MIFLIFGTKYRQRKIEAPEGFSHLTPQYCPNCGNYRVPLFIRSDSWFSFFFLPIFRIHKGHQIEVKCSCCQAPMVLPPKGVHSTYLRPEEISSEVSKAKDREGGNVTGDSTSNGLVCPACGMPWDPNNKFCPNDGTPRLLHVSKN